MIIAEQLLGQAIWSGVKLSQCLRKVLSLILCDTSIFGRLARENNCFHIYEVWISSFSNNITVQLYSLMLHISLYKGAVKRVKGICRFVSTNSSC